MSRAMNPVWCLSIILGSLLVLGCGASKPSYSDASVDCGCPDAGTANPSGSDLGHVCGYDQDCQQACILGLNGMSPYCTRSCATKACPKGYLCMSHEQQGMVCVIGHCQGPNDCPSGYTCLANDPDYPNTCRHDDVGCNADEDCPAATACNQKKCTLLCEADEHCKAGFYCEWHRRCSHCASDAHCANAFSCQDGNCNTSCADDQDCRLGYACTQPKCNLIAGGGPGGLDAGCQDNTECQDFCYNNQCSKTCTGPDDTTSCPAGYHCHPGVLICVQD